MFEETCLWRTLIFALGAELRTERRRMPVCCLCTIFAMVPGMTDPNDVSPDDELTRLRRRNAELEAAARRFQALVDSGVISVQLYDAKSGLCTEVNDAFVELWKIEREQITQYSILRDEQVRAYGFMHLVERAFHDGAGARLPAIRYEPSQLEFGSDAQAQWVASALAPVVDAEGVREVIQLHLPVGELMQSEEELREQNRRLEQAVEARTAELGEKLRLIEAQQREILALSTPVLQLWDRVLALPLIGRLDAERAATLLETLLRRVVETRAEHVLLDVTGVPQVDVEAAGYLRDVVRAARLLGSSCALVGISPEIADSLVTLNIDLAGVPTFATLQDGLRNALAASRPRG